MCGRFSQAFTWEQIVGFSNLVSDPGNVPNLQARYNIAPTTEISIVVKTEAGRVLRKARWGLVPAWWKKKASETGATFNARVETIHSSGMFKQAYVKRRCIIPASGFYEWTGPKGEKIPHRISAADGGLLAFAGLWETWRNPETGEDVTSCTIITRDADKWMSAIHDRMPAMLHPNDFDAWLDGTGGKELLMRPPPELREWIVSQRMNRTGVGDDDPATAEPFKETLF
jgi:putative SOS response-associated peptidase YedK